MLSLILSKSIRKAVGKEDFDLTITENQNFGDYTTNAALKITSSSKSKNPRVVAEDLKAKLEKDKELMEVVAKIEIAGPGFINFWIKEKYLLEESEKITKQTDSYGKNDALKGSKIMFEYGQPNTHKLPHIAHLFSYIYGESATRLLEASGATIYRANYQGDVGLHVAKCLWAFRKNNPKEPQSLQEKVELLQKMYQEGSAVYEEDENAQKEIQELNTKIYKKDPEIFDLWEKTRGWSIEYYKKFEERLGIKYDRYYYESQVYKEGLKAVEDNLGKVFIKSEGAIIFEGSKYGLHDRVFVTKYGTPTYEAKDLYLENLKYKEWPFDLLIIATANEQSEYFKVIYKALEIVNPELKGKLKHIGFGLINLKSGKMSSRTGQIVSAVGLVDTVVDRVKQLGSTKTDVSEDVGLAAVKYSFLKNNPLQNTVFSIDESIASEGNSGPYLQYTFARANTVLIKAKSAKSKLTEETKLNKDELLLLRSFPQFPEVIASAAKNYSPNLLATYLYNLAQKYNTFYNSNKIIGSDNEEVRLAITAATAQVIKNGLKLLGIETLERM